MYDEDDVIAAKQDREQWTNPDRYEARKDRERQEEIEREIGLLRLQCTDLNRAEDYISEYIADPYRFAAEFLRVVALYIDDHATIGALVSNLARNRWRVDAEHIVDKRLDGVKE